MPRPASRIVRIAITLPRDLLAAADRRARALDRSRSWVIADAIRHVTVDAVPARSDAVEPRSGLGDSRQAQLAADLRLTPEQRVREAELTARGARRPPNRKAVFAFDRYEDYLDWKRLQDLGA